MMKRFLLLLPLLFIGTLLAQENESPSAETLVQEPSSTGPNGPVYALAVQADGKILIGGQFNSVDGYPRGNLARLNADGTLDRSFVEGIAAGVNGTVQALAVDDSGRILVGGFFNTAASQPHPNLVRFLADGTVDASFGSEGTPNGSVNALAILPGGNIAAGGEFSMVGSNPVRNFVLLSPDGALASSGEAGSPIISGTIRALAPRTTGVVAGGQFQVGGTIRKNLSVLE